MHQRPAQRLEELAVEHVAGAVLGHLAGAAGDDVLVALAAGLGVVGRAQAVGDGLGLLEDEAVVVERAQRHDVVLVQRVERLALGIHAVGLAVEPGRGLGGIASAEERALRIHGPGADERLPAAIVGAPILPRFLRRDDAHARHQGDEPASGQHDRRAAQQSGEAAQGAESRTVSWRDTPHTPHTRYGVDQTCIHDGGGIGGEPGRGSWGQRGTLLRAAGRVIEADQEIARGRRRLRNSARPPAALLKQIKKSRGLRGRAACAAGSGIRARPRGTRRRDTARCARRGRDTAAGTRDSARRRSCASRR